MGGARQLVSRGKELIYHKYFMAAPLFAIIKYVEMPKGGYLMLQIGRETH